MSTPTPKRMVVNAVLENLKRTQASFVNESMRQASCQTSWGKQRDLAAEDGVTGITFTADDEKHEKEALAGYDRKLRDLQQELEKWEQALGHALDGLEGRG
jgi:hypothetical protein